MKKYRLTWILTIFLLAKNIVCNCQQLSFKHCLVDTVNIISFNNSGLNKYKGKRAGINQSQKLVITYDSKLGFYKPIMNFKTKSVYFWDKKKSKIFRNKNQGINFYIDVNILENVLNNFDKYNYKLPKDSIDFSKFIDTLNLVIEDLTKKHAENYGIYYKLGKTDFVNKLKNRDTIKTYFRSLLDSNKNAFTVATDVSTGFIIRIVTKKETYVYSSMYLYPNYQPWFDISNFETISQNKRYYKMGINELLYNLLPQHFYLKEALSLRNIAISYIEKIAEKENKSLHLPKTKPK